MGLTDMDRSEKWQWVSTTYGPMGWFTAEEKKAHEGTESFSDGKWVPVAPAEVDSFNRWVGRLAYEQS